MDELEARIAELREREELDAMRPELDGNEVMARLGLAPGREVGEALAFLLDLRLDEGVRRGRRGRPPPRRVVAPGRQMARPAPRRRSRPTLDARVALLS